MGCFNLQSTIVCVLLVVGYSFQEQPIVNIPTLGSVRGSQMSSASGRSFYAFRGIPYGQPPVGDLRFKDPLPAIAWDTLLDGSREAPTCVQFNPLNPNGFVYGQEDCLFLNVYTPNISGSSLPVMVWIHGGAYYMGSGNGDTDRFGPDYMLDRDVVLVTINYRLGPLGFLSTEDAEAPGNYGLLDQSLALRWVRNHILHFGGNPDLITLFGESAGAASVDLQVLSPYSKGLFHRAIVQSGTSLCPWGVSSVVGEYTKILANHLGCPLAPSRAMLTCLRTKSPEDIVGIRKHIIIDIGFGMFPLAFIPRVDVERAIPFIPAHPYELITQKKFHQVPIVVGVVKNEGAVVTASLLVNEGKSMELFKSDPIGNIRYMIDMELREDGREKAKIVHDRYFQKKIPYEHQLEQIEKINSDYGIFKGTDESVRLYSVYNSQPTYYYFYSHKGQFSFPQMAGVPHDIDLGVCHADEIFLMLSCGLLPKIRTPADIKVSQTLLDLWTSFASEGVPRSQHVNDNWLPVKNEKICYLNINTESSFVNEKMPFATSITFWNHMKYGLAMTKNDEL